MPDQSKRAVARASEKMRATSSPWLLAALTVACTTGEPEPQSSSPLEDEAAMEAVEGDSEPSMSIALLAQKGGRGQLIDSSYLRSLNPQKVRELLDDAGFSSASVNYGVDLHQLLYTTVDPDGKPTQASGLIALPRRAKRVLSVVSYAHGTELSRDDAPSVADDSWGPAASLVYASAGFVAVAPDYLGQGDGPGLHPWMHVPSEVTASHDLLRAARAFAWQHGRVLERKVWVTGFSQGAFAALGLAHALEQGVDSWFRLGAVAPISAPYEFRSYVEAAARGELESDKIATVYLAYLSVAWNRLDAFYAQPSDFFLGPYSQFVESLFDGNHDGEQVVNRLPDAPDQLFTGKALALLQQPEGALGRAFAPFEGICSGFDAGTPVHLFGASGDDEVPFKHSTKCQAQLAASGARVSLTDVGDVGHTESNQLATPKILQLFLSR